jgi:CRISPR-associated protein Cmr5
VNDVFLTREQEYAGRVYDKIKDITVWDEPKRKAYGSLAHKLPVLIRTAGLAQSLAFVKARNKEHTPQRQLLLDLESVLRQRKVLEEDTELVEQSRIAGFDEYMRLTEATLEALLWFKRFAQSELKVEPTDEPQERRDATT